MTVIVCKSWKEFATHITPTPPQFQRECDQAFDALVLEALQEVDLKHIIDPLGDIVFRRDVCESMQRVAYLTGLRARDTPGNGKLTWRQFATPERCAEANRIFDKYTLLLNDFYHDLRIKFRTLLPRVLRCAGPRPCDIDCQESAEWMGELAMDYHMSGASYEDKMEEDAQAMDELDRAEADMNDFFASRRFSMEKMDSCSPPTSVFGEGCEPYNEIGWTNLYKNS